jgi:exodeoxyribonuclease III
MPADLHLVSWNIDGFERTLAQPSPPRRRSTKPVARMALKDLHRELGSPDILALQEIRIRATDAGLTESLDKALPGYVCGHSLSRDPINVRFRGGRAYGVATFVRSELEPRWLERPEWDREGRFVAFELPERNLLVANLYAVNGTDRPYYDPESGEVTGDRHAFKRRFQELLHDYLSAVRARGLDLVLAGDWNVSRAAIDTHPRLRTEPVHVAARAMLNDVLMPALEVEDVFRVLQPAARAYTWFNRVAARYGRLDAARVDYVLVSRSLMPAISSATILHEMAPQLGSDHAPVAVRLSGRDYVESID